VNATLTTAHRLHNDPKKSKKEAKLQVVFERLNISTMILHDVAKLPDDDDCVAI
jgi:hypothetical protein